MTGFFARTFLMINTITGGNPMRSHIYFVLAFCILSAGCTSFTSTVLKRFDDNTYAGQSAGHNKILGQPRPFKGIPITLKVPTHLDIYIKETYFVQLDEISAKEPLAGKVRLLDIQTEIIKSDKVFTVDFKRPAAGFLDLDMTFDQEEQYFSKIISQLQDDTITDTASLVATSIKTISAIAASRTPLPDDLKKILKAQRIEQDTRVVAFQRFDIDSPSFEQDVECFVQLHLNGCNQCGTPPTYDSPMAFPQPVAYSASTTHSATIANEVSTKR